ncbi:MAG: excinuclease ABC subunit UvrA [Verrucomicrobiota bacterium]|nr:excinuclease ABC subunit UvrA [Verrucomicrobiota bacterium]
MKNKNSDIIVKGASQHNLKHIDVTIPRDAMTVITGLSGSGKSSLAFDTLYAEGQRRYVESLSSYARQFLDQLQKPKVEHITGLSPAIAIEQRSASSNPRSTVATTTEIYDYLRLLYAHTGHPHCPKCSKPIESQNPQSICNYIMTFPDGKKMMLLAPYVVGKKGEHKDILDSIRKDGFVRARIDGEIKNLDDKIKLKKTYKHTIEAVADRLITGKSSSSRLSDSVELSLKCGNGTMTILLEKSSNEWTEEIVSEHLACTDCNLSFGKLEPRNFSFNSPYGACKKCHGLGHSRIFKEELVIPNTKLSIKKGAIPLWRRGPRRLIQYYNKLLKNLAKFYNFDLNTPFEELSEKIRNIIIYGSGDENVHFSFRWGGRQYKADKPFEGVIPNLKRRILETESEAVRKRLEKAMVNVNCPACKGKRLKPESLAVTVGDISIYEFTALNISDAKNFLESLSLTKEEEKIADEIIREVVARLGFLEDVGLEYLNLNRKSGTLSGGEAQRIKLATQVGSGLVGVLYILDEPSIGLHQRDNKRLLKTLRNLCNIGNTAVIVEHDSATMLAADKIIDLGPGAGRLGGEVVYSGSPKNIIKCKESITGDYLSGRRQIEIPAKRKKGTGKFIKIIAASENNLKNIDVRIPLGTFCCITGVSGSGKSSLIDQTLKKALNRHFGYIKDAIPGKHKEINGLKNIKKMIVIDQSPIGRTPRSNPITYTKAFSAVRELFAKIPEAKARGYKKGRFSFNVKGGRCEACKGDGIKKIEMHFLPDVYVQCAECAGKRYNKETLSIRYKGRNIYDVLEMTVDDAYDFFSAIPSLEKKLKTLQGVGLGYIHLGQPATTLSGGEAQRIKLSSELAKQTRGHTLYILDEPTTGLHTADIHKLLDVLQTLRNQGNTVIIIEHNLDVIKTADHIIDLGPEGGDQGGFIVAEGTPEKIAKNNKSYTGQFLKHTL